MGKSTRKPRLAFPSVAPVEVALFLLWCGMSETVPLAEQKQRMRKQALAKRKAQENKDEISRNIVAKFRELPAYHDAHTVLFYIGVRSEVRTTVDLARELKRVP
jgi:hypothetical protein